MMKKIFVIVLAVALLGAAVGVGIHILHRDARAQIVTVTVVLFDAEGPVVNVDGLIARLKDITGAIIGAGPIVEVPGNPGTYTFTGGDAVIPVIKWEAELPFNIAPVNPVDNPHSMIYDNQDLLNWEVIDSR